MGPEPDSDTVYRLLDLFKYDTPLMSSWVTEKFTVVNVLSEKLKVTMGAEPENELL